jgi:hypothetical protein
MEEGINMAILTFINKYKRKKILNLESNNALHNLEMIIKLTTKKNNPISFNRTNWKDTLKKVGKIIFFNEWEDDCKEYMPKYVDGIGDYDELKEYVKSDLEPIFNFLILNKYDHRCNYILAKYEIMILTIKNTLIESIQINKNITKEIKFKTIDLLYEFVNEINEIRKDVDQLKNSEINTMNQSLENRLDLELDYQQKFGNKKLKK